MYLPLPLKCICASGNTPSGESLCCRVFKPELATTNRNVSYLCGLWVGSYLCGLLFPMLSGDVQRSTKDCRSNKLK